MLHSLEIVNGAVFLDGNQIKGVTGYEVKGSAENTVAELTLKLDVADSHILLDEITNDTNSNFG